MSLLSAFTEGSHHKNISVVFLMQNIYHKGAHTRTMSINTQNMVLFKNSRDVRQIEMLERQVFGGDSGQFMKYYHEQTSKLFGFVVLDLHPSTPINERIVRNFGPKIVARPIESKKTKTNAEQLFDLRQQIMNPYAKLFLEAKKKYEDVMNDPTKTLAQYPDVQHNYHDILKKFKEAEVGKRHVLRLMPPSRAIEDTKKNGDLIDLHQPTIKTINSLLDEETKKSGDLIDLHQPAIKSIKLKSERDLMDLHGDEISILSDGTPEVRPEDVALPPSDASDFEDDEEEESRDGENSQLLSLDDTPEEQEAKYNYIERTRRPPSPLPDERIDEKDTDHRLFSYDDTDDEKRKKRNYIKKYNLRRRTPLNYPRSWKGPTTIMDDDDLSSDEENEKRTMSL